MAVRNGQACPPSQTVFLPSERMMAYKVASDSAQICTEE